jgi:hypothetical protein
VYPATFSILDMSTYLAPVASSSKLPASPSLALLPFALGTSNNAYKSSSAPINQYFQPRPCPADVTGIPEGTPIAAFRGRQLVGHSIQLPPGYRGLVITAPQPHTTESKWPLTPAPSVTSADPSASASSSTRRSPRKSTLANVADAIKSKVRGAGQVALSKPKTRQAKQATVKRRYQIDSEDEDETHIELARVETPRKRTRSGTTATPMIVVQEATPLKEPLPTPKKRLGTISREERLPGVGRRSRSPSPAPTDVSQSSEAVIPSPATEHDPPTFPIDTKPATTGNVKVEKEEEADDATRVRQAMTPAPTETELVKSEEDLPEISEMNTNARILRPSSTFESFTLWTPDGPLPGFKQDETEAEAENEGEAEGGVKLRKGWWRTGGAGEGGDEIVRALGEWIGLVEEVSRIFVGITSVADNLAQQASVSRRQR